MALPGSPMFAPQWQQLVCRSKVGSPSGFRKFFPEPGFGAAGAPIRLAVFGRPNTGLYPKSCKQISRFPPCRLMGFKCGQRKEAEDGQHCFSRCFPWFCVKVQFAQGIRCPEPPARLAVALFFYSDHGCIESFPFHTDLLSVTRRCTLPTPSAVPGARGGTLRTRAGLGPGSLF